MTRSSRALGVHSLDHITLSVPDLDPAEHFYSAFGLDVRHEGENLGVYAQDGHRSISVRPGAAKRLLHVTFGAFSEDIPALAARLAREGVAQIAAPDTGQVGGLWFRNLDGLPIQVSAASKSSPDAKSAFNHPPSAPAGVAAASARSRAAAVHPRRLSHVAIFTRDVPASIAFYEKTLGLRLSDRALDLVAFMHGPHGSDHHMLALVKSDGPGMHHCSWDVGSIEEVGLGAAQVAVAAGGRGWGLGRHVLGSNYFHYVRDPWGSYSEYSADIDYIGAADEWKAGDHAPEDAMNVWGGSPPEDFMTNYETAAILSDRNHG